MNMQITTYNPAAVAFGLFSAVFEWLDSGLIELTFHATVWGMGEVGGGQWGFRG